MKTIEKLLVAAVLAVSAGAIAAPPAGRPGLDPERRAERAQKIHLALVIGLADALSLNEAEALKLSEKLKGYEAKRRPVREGMGESLRILKAAADGDPVAATQVDGAVQKLFDGRQQMAALDKEMFNGLAKDLNPQKRAKLAMFLARFHAEAKGWKGGKGRHHRRG